MDICILISICSSADVAEEVVSLAFKAGYRHVVKFCVGYVLKKLLIHMDPDSARAYRNEQPCSDAIMKSGIKRSEIFFTSKVPPRAMGYEKTKAAIESSFAQTKLDYIDLYVIFVCSEWMCPSISSSFHARRHRPILVVPD